VRNTSTDCTPTIIELAAVSKVYHHESVATQALVDVHLRVHQGEYVCIAGPSGCGKSTLLSILGLLDTPTAGLYTFAGRATAGLSAAERAQLRRRQIGLVFQAFNLIGDLTVHENVELPLTYRSMSSAERAARAREVLERVSMSHRSQYYPTQLSGGQQQRVAVARAIVGEPAILLADEPTGNLDSRNSAAMMELLAELHERGVTLCMVTHDETHARRAERVIQMRDGRVVEDQS
jgi:putative ABC transport system ATP-binding protein